MAAKSKSYLNNPALQFISTALVDEATAAPEAVPAPSQTKAAPAAKRETSAQSAPAAAPASRPVIEREAPAQSAKFLVPMKPVYVEVRSKRFNALMQPSLYNNLSKLAAANGVSVNELMHRVLEKYVEDNLAE